MIDGDDPIRNVIHAIVQASPPAPPLPPIRARRRLLSGPAVGVAVFVAVVVVFVGVGSLLRGGTVGSGDDLIRAHSRRLGMGGMDAIVSGVVEVDLDDGCVWLTDPGGSRSPVVWPAGTTAHRDPFSIELRDGQTIEPGDRVEGGGGSVDADQATEFAGAEPFPEQCLTTGEAAVFNAGSEIVVTPDVGLQLPATLVQRFQVPQPIPLELIAVAPGTASVAVVDLVSATVSLYGPDDYESAEGGIQGASGGGGFITLWRGGEVYAYPGRVTDRPVKFDADLLEDALGTGPLPIRVVTDPDGQRLWLVNPRCDGCTTTTVELVSLEGLEVSRLDRFELDGGWNPVGATTDGLVLVSDQAQPTTIVVQSDGAIAGELAGRALSVGWNGVAVLAPGDQLLVADTSLSNPTPVSKPAEGSWVPAFTSFQPPLTTGQSSYLVGLSPSRSESSSVVVVRPDGSAEALGSVANDAIGTWSRDERWIVIVEDRNVSLLSLDGEFSGLGALIPEGHQVVTAG